MNISQLEEKTSAELQEIAKDLEIAGYTRFRKRELIFEILKAETNKEGLVYWRFCPMATDFCG